MERLWRGSENFRQDYPEEQVWKRAVGGRDREDRVDEGEEGPRGAGSEATRPHFGERRLRRTQ